MDNRIYDIAHDIMRNRRTKAVEINDSRTNRLFSEIPEIREISNSLFNTSKELISIISNGGRVNIERVKQKNLESQERLKYLLVSHGYSSDYLDIHYNCPKCSDTGYINSNFCDCMKKLFVELMAEEINQNSHIELSDFESFDLKYYTDEDYYTMQKIFNFVKSYAENFTSASENILMSGSTGLGKTHLSLAIANKVIEKGFNVIYDSTLNILYNIDRERYNEGNTLDAVLDADLLILDDLGTEQETKSSVPTIYNIINTRIVRKKSTVISTNLDSEEISQRYGARVRSRLMTVYRQLHFSGKDIRLQIRREQLSRK
ncbi:MAG: ATP-binding protein [Ruminococcus sp.]|nr:ATP-binding protein [Ruminococcus sp.]